MEGSTQVALLNLPTSQDRPTPTYHDVFLSCAVDTRKRLASHLCKALHRSGVQTSVSIDNDDGGWDACSKGPRIFVVLFSKSYGSSTNRLEELAKAMENRGNVAVLPVFVDVEPYEVRNQAGCFGEAFVLHEETVGNGKSVDRWREALKNAGELKGWHLKNVSNGHQKSSEDTCQTSIHFKPSTGG